MEIKNPISQQVWQDRYSKNGETLEENLSRVAKYCAKNSEEEKEFFDFDKFPLENYKIVFLNDVFVTEKDILNLLATNDGDFD